uniref:SAP domain-containing protein n=1 Tax=Strongyloides papillosus TaxID=174720 RepID=A0A0N5BFV7_STREA
MTGETDSTGHYINGIAVDTMKVTELRSTLAQYGLSTKGVKKELLLRLVEYIKTTQEDKAEDQKEVESVESVNVEVSVADSFQELQSQPPANEQGSANENDKLNESFIEDSNKNDLSAKETLEEDTNGLAEPTKDISASQSVSLQEEKNDDDTTKDTSGVIVPIETNESKDDSSMETSASEATDKKVEDKTDKPAIHENGLEEKSEADNESNVNENKKPEGEEKSSGVSIESRITRINIKKDDSDSSQEKPRAKKRERIVFESDFKGLYSNSSTETLESPMPSKKRLLENDVVKQEEQTVRHGLLIENLQRPWNNGTIKRKLETFGKILSDSICSNEKKTVCLVLFENEETAVMAQKALDGTTSLPCSSQGLAVKKIDGSEYNSLKENINSENGVLSKPVVVTPPKKMTSITTTDQQIKKDYDRDGRKSLSKTENHHHQKDNSKDHQIYKSSKGPEKDKDAIMNHRFAGLFPLETKNVIYINNLTRPFCALQLKAMLQVHNTMLEDHFHLMDKKSKCVAVYKNEEAATAISAVLAENKFPQDELGKILNSRIITFEEYIRKLLNSRIEGGPHVDPSSSGDHMISESKAKRNSPSPRKRSPIPERKSHLRREDNYKREPNVAPSLPGMKVTDAKPSLAFAENSYKMPSIHDGWEIYNRNERFEDRRRRNDVGFNRRRRSISRDRR